MIIYARGEPLPNNRQIIRIINVKKSGSPLAITFIKCLSSDVIDIEWQFHTS